MYIIMIKINYLTDLMKEEKNVFALKTVIAKKTHRERNRTDKMNKTIKNMAVMLLVLLMMTSCGAQVSPVEESALTAGQSVTEATTEVTEVLETTTSVVDAPVLDVVKNGSTSFKVVRADGASDEIVVASMLLRKALNEAIGANVGIASELSKKDSDGQNEILVGITNRGISQEFKDSLTGQMFGIKVTENSIVIAATHEDFVPLAVDYFLEHYMENNEYVTIAEGTYSISTAASITCEGVLADLTNIRPDTNYATISELVGNVPREGNFKILQGGCVTDQYAYMAVLNTTDYDTKDAGCYIYKFSKDTWKVVKRSELLMLAHANDITYNPNTNQLFVVHCYVDGTKISIIDADTLKLVDTLHTDIDIYALDYYAPTNTFVGGARLRTCTFFFRYSPKGDRLLTTGQITPIETKMTTQGICRDDKYVYHVMYSTDNKEPYNTIIIYDLETKKPAQYIRLSISGQEPENISLVDGVFYIGCNPKYNTLDIYKSVLYEFDFDACKPMS